MALHQSAVPVWDLATYQSTAHSHRESWHSVLCPFYSSLKTACFKQLVGCPGQPLNKATSYKFLKTARPKQFCGTKQGHTFFIFQFLCFYFFAFILSPVSCAVSWSLQTTDPFWGGSIAHLPFVSVHCIVVSTGAMGMDYELAPSRD